MYQVPAVPLRIGAVRDLGEYLDSWIVHEDSYISNCFELFLDIGLLFTIFVRRFTEPETAVKFQFDSFRE